MRHVRGLTVERIPFFAIGALLVLTGAAVEFSVARAADLPSIDLPALQNQGILRPPRRRPLPTPPPTFKDFQLPTEPPPAPPELPPPTGPRIVVKGFRFEGNTVIPGKELDRVAQNYVGRPIAMEDLEKLRYELTRLYIDQGYINSGALLPDQEVTDGIVLYQIVEGVLSKIDVTGTGWLAPSYVIERLELGAGPPLNVNELRDRFRILLQDPLIERMNGEIVPGPERGEAGLNVEVERARPYSIALAFDNWRNPSIGEFQGSADGIIRNLTGYGDALRSIYYQTEGGQQFYGEASVPVTPYDTTLRLAVQLSRAKIVEGNLEDLDIKSKEQHYVLGIHQPLFRTPSHDLSAGFVFQYEQNTTYLLGDRFSFSPGVDNGRSKVTALRPQLEYTYRGFEDAISARGTLSKGVDLFGATNNDSGPDGQFTSFLGQFYWAHRFDDRGDAIILRSEAQLSNSKLLPIEKYEIGGATSVRGYRENFLISDEGMDASLEGRIVAVRFGIPEIGLMADTGVITIAPFFDYGYVWNKDGSDQALYSTGVGLLVDLGPYFHGQVYYGKRLKSVDDPGDTLQDNGIQFRVVARY